MHQKNHLLLPTALAVKTALAMIELTFHKLSKLNPQLQGFETGQKHLSRKKASRVIFRFSLVHFPNTWNSTDLTHGREPGNQEPHGKPQR